MTAQSNAEPAVAGAPIPELTAAPVTNPVKAKKESGGVWPKKLKVSAALQPAASNLEFSGRVEKINVKELAAGLFLTTFILSAKNRGKRSYEIGAGEAAFTGLVLAAFADRRKLKVATVPGENGHPRIVEIEAWK